MLGGFPAFRNQFVYSIRAWLDITPDLPPRLFDPLSPRRDAYGVLFRLEDDFVSGIDSKHPAHSYRNDDSAISSHFDTYGLLGHYSLTCPFYFFCRAVKNGNPNAGSIAPVYFRHHEISAFGSRSGGWVGGLSGGGSFFVWVGEQGAHDD
jgi:hypothetical protein